MIKTVFSSAHDMNSAFRDRSKNLSIKGKILQRGIPYPGRVRVFDKAIGVLVSEVLTDNYGVYQINNLKNIQYFVVAHHLSNQFNAVIQDNVVPK